MGNSGALGMRYAQIDENGLCFAESTLASAVDDPTLIEIAEGVQVIGKRWDGSVWHDFSTDPPDYTQITRRQGLITLYTEQGIKESDVQSIIDEIEDASQQYIAQIEFANQYWEIGNPWISRFADALEITPERLQELFNIASTI